MSQPGPGPLPPGVEDTWDGKTEYSPILGYGGVLVPPEPELASFDLWIFLFSVALFSISFFLLHQGVAFQRWVVSNEKNAPDPNSGVMMSWMLSIMMILIWVLHSLLFREFWIGSFTETIFYVLENPLDFSPAVLIASVVPAAVALYKFLITGSLMRALPDTKNSVSRSPVAVMAGAICTLLTLCASIATLISITIHEVF